MDPTNPWLAKSNAEFVEGWMEAWWIDARSHAETDRVRRRLLQESDPVRFALNDIVDHDPARALEIAFLIARAADSPWMMLDVGVGILQVLTNEDPTLWDAIALEAKSSPELVRAAGHVWENDVPDDLWAAHQALVGREAEDGQSEP